MGQTQSLGITVAIPPPLRSSVDGRTQVLLGLPVTAGPGDVLQTLLQLYPRLARAVAHERPTRGPHWLQVGLDDRSLALLARGGTGLYDGQTLALFCARGASREEKGRTGG